MREMSSSFNGAGALHEPLLPESDTARIAGGPSDRAPLNHTSSPGGDQARAQSHQWLRQVVVLRERSTTTTSPGGYAWSARLEERNAIALGETRIDQIDLARAAWCRLETRAPSCSACFTTARAPSGPQSASVTRSRTSRGRPPASDARARVPIPPKRTEVPEGPPFLPSTTPRGFCRSPVPTSAIPCCRAARRTFIRSCIPGRR